MKAEELPEKIWVPPQTISKLGSNERTMSGYWVSENNQPEDLVYIRTPATKKTDREKIVKIIEKAAYNMDADPDSFGSGIAEKAANKILKLIGEE